MNLIIESHEGNIYLACHEKDGERHYLTGENEMPRRFSHVNEIRDCINPKEFNDIVLVQAAPYDEMVGMQSSTDSTVCRYYW